MIVGDNVFFFGENQPKMVDFPLDFPSVLMFSRHVGASGDFENRKTKAGVQVHHLGLQMPTTSLQRVDRSMIIPRYAYSISLFIIQCQCLLILIYTCIYIYIYIYIYVYVYIYICICRERERSMKIPMFPQSIPNMDISFASLMLKYHVFMVTLW